MPEKAPLIKASILDHCIGLVSPKAKAGRLYWKNVSAGMRAYEGASQSTRVSQWMATGGSANSELAGSIKILRDRARDLRRNNCYAKSGIGAITSNMVGPGIMTTFSAGENKDKAKLINDAWKKWAKSKESDFDGKHNYYGNQQVVSDAIVETGEVIIRKRYVKPTEKNPIGLQLQILEADHLDADIIRQQLSNGNHVLQGIEFDNQGKKINYHLYERHPGGPSALGMPSLKKVPIPAREIMHPFRMDRPGQVRGVTWFASIIIKTHDYDEYEDSVLMRQKIANAYAVYITDIASDMEGPSLAASIAGTKGDTKDDIEGNIQSGMIKKLPTGKTIVTADPPGVKDTHKDYANITLHAIASGLEVPYELLARDLSDVNYSSLRAGLLQFIRDCKTWRAKFFYPQYMDEVADEFLKLLILRGIDTRGVAYKHTEPRRELIDPVKEIPAKVKEIRSGLTPWSTAVEEMGRDPVETLRQFKLDADEFDKHTLIFDCDPRRVSIVGKAQSEELFAAAQGIDIDDEDDRNLIRIQ